jgi:Tol biopolymer transport system component
VRENVVFATVALVALLLRSEDYTKLRSVGSAQLSPDGSSVAYSVVNNDGEGRPYRQLWIASVQGGNPRRIGGDADRGGDAVWSPDGRLIAFNGRVSGRRTASTS